MFRGLVGGIVWLQHVAFFNFTVTFPKKNPRLTSWRQLPLQVCLGCPRGMWPKRGQAPAPNLPRASSMISTHPGTDGKAQSIDVGSLSSLASLLASSMCTKVYSSVYIACFLTVDPIRAARQRPAGSCDCGECMQASFDPSAHPPPPPPPPPLPVFTPAFRYEQFDNEVAAILSKSPSMYQDVDLPLPENPGNPMPANSLLGRSPSPRYAAPVMSSTSTLAAKKVRLLGRPWVWAVRL